MCSYTNPHTRAHLPSQRLRSLYRLRCDTRPPCLTGASPPLTGKGCGYWWHTCRSTPTPHHTWITIIEFRVPWLRSVLLFLCTPYFHACSAGCISRKFLASLAVHLQSSCTGVEACAAMLHCHFKPQDPALPMPKGGRPYQNVQFTLKVTSTWYR